MRRARGAAFPKMRKHRAERKAGGVGPQERAAARWSRVKEIL